MAGPCSAAYACLREHAALPGRGSGGADDKGQTVSQDVRRTPPWARTDAAPADIPTAPTPQEETVSGADASADDVTVGTGSVIALGCIAGTVLLILIGLLFIGLTMLF